ncbi:A24 family peptidase [Kribbella sp. NPDC048915]|uniref:A24 family peptidase n=1 Tax=Kribbella sp. NPDC048915 TaxID=3155148 RepID=UPI0033D9B5F2
MSGRFAIRCASCRGWFGVPFALELTTAGVLALVLSRFAGHADAAGFAFIGALGVALAAVDVAVQRLPDRLTLPLYPGLLVLFAIAAAIEGRPGSLLRALLGCLVLGGSYFVLGVLSRGQLGAGDVKLAGAIGIALGWLGWPTLLFGASLGFLLMGVVSFGLLVLRRVTLRHSLSFGPFMLGGALVAILTAA